MMHRLSLIAALSAAVLTGCQSVPTADEIDRMRAWLEDTLSKHSGKPVEQVRRDIERDKILTAPQAAEYGLIDQVLESRKAL